MSKKESVLSRRDFIRAAAMASLGSFLSTREASGKIAAPDTSEELVVPTRPFGKTGVEVSCLSLGGMFDVPSNQLLLKQALGWGVAYWDTADCYGYGRSEKGMGRFFAKHPETREKVFLVTKSDDRDPEGLSRLLNQSLERTKSDYIDLYFVHGIGSIRELNDKTRVWAEKAKAAGKIRLFGFSTHGNMEECMLAAAKLDWIDGIMMSYNYQLMHTSKMKEAVAACSEAGIGLTAMKTQGGGQVETHSEAGLKLAGRFLQRGFTDKQAKLKAVWENPSIASICSQMPSLTILMSNVAAALDRTSLSPGESRLLNQYAHETASGYCAGCTDICETALAHAAPVGEVMRYLMYYRSYGERDLARSLYARLPPDLRQNLGRLDYSLAEKACPRSLPIGKLIREAGKILV